MSRARFPLPRILLATALLGCAGSVPASEGPVPAADPQEERARPAPSDAERVLSRGLLALSDGDYRVARRALSRVAGDCPGTVPGVEALVALLAVELDPRNADADPARARQLAEAFLALPVKPAWTEPTVETLYLLSLDAAAARQAAKSGDRPAEEPVGWSGARPEATTGTIGGAEEVREGSEGWLAWHRWGARDAAHDDNGSFGSAASPFPEERRAPAAGNEGPFPPLRSCEVTGVGLSTGASLPPDRARPGLAELFVAARADRDSLQATVVRLEREVRELRQELARIRETLKP